jgi:hypothetical protein
MQLVEIVKTITWHHSAKYVSQKGEISNMWTIILILVVLWLLGFFGGNISPRIPKTGNWIHVLIVIAIILIILNLLGIV